MEKKSLIIYSAIVLLGLGAMLAVVLILRSRNAPLAETEALAKPAASPAGSVLPAPKQPAEVRKYQSLDEVPQAKTSGSNAKILEQ